MRAGESLVTAASRPADMLSLKVDRDGVGLTARLRHCSALEDMKRARVISAIIEVTDGRAPRRYDCPATSPHD